MLLTAIPGLCPSISGGKRDNVCVGESLFSNGSNWSPRTGSYWPEPIFLDEGKLYPDHNAHPQSWDGRNPSEQHELRERFEPQIGIRTLFPEEEGRDIGGGGKAQESLGCSQQSVA